MSASAILPSGPAVLRDGAAVEVRPARDEDRAALEHLHDDAPGVRDVLAAASTGLVAVAGAEVVGHASFTPRGARRAELAVAVADGWRRRGVATVLLERLVAEAGAQGLRLLTARVAPAQHGVVQVLEDLGLPVAVRAEPGVVHVELPASVTPEARARFERRHRRAAVAGLDHVLRPSAIAVVGASERRGSVGGEVLRNLLGVGFTGALHAVHPRASRVAGVPAVARATDLPADVDLAVVAVPADGVRAVAEDCAAAGVRALVVLSAGFGEAGLVGRRRQDELLAVCRSAGMRLVGPNCLGVVNTDPDVRLDATFAPQRVPPGGVALASQSGAVGIVAMDAAARRGMGLSSFVSLGDRADVSSNDLVRFWADDPRTRVIALYLESFGNPRAFAEAAREVAAVKPVVAVKAGRSAAGVRAAASHTGALVEGADALADALLHDAGVIRVDSVRELLDTAALLDRGGRPRGRRIAVLTNAGGGGIACADAAEDAGLSLPRPRPATRERLRRIRQHAAVDNPVDVLADASPAAYGAALEVVADDPCVDAVIAIHVPPLAGREDGTLDEVAARAPDLGVPVVAVPLAQVPPASLVERLPVLETPEDAARALGRVARWAQSRPAAGTHMARPRGIRRAAGAAVVARGLAAGAGWLDPELAGTLAHAYGIPLATARLAPTPSAVGDAARALGSAVAVKAVVPGLVHKTEHGAVRLDLRTPADAADAATDLSASLGGQGLHVAGFQVQAMVPVGVELLVGAMSHPSFGPIVLCGAGGTTAELWNDVQVHLAPVDRRTASEMLRALRSWPLLAGWRGATAVHVRAVEDVVRRMSHLVADRPEVAELECNPLVATPEGALAVDLRVRLHAA
ncbi:bifunctional GNAT family N-acetyltransferase/acetate--CoA ligase family protein [Conexibacter sp. SYSU D00693]|uniref:bifunctional GNAT family N-acetyltransferase/acetate--CoA ligase family protein n=1 Tax=Conexibacter sp. SYSU D00693 TaxID=2812560 RepID=UPI00196AEAA9|nr:bifunctional GNAT family N-acetyltransferase/acetate--CoA ligase family protein [Conexibacter sp. SYSU D00693]